MKLREFDLRIDSPNGGEDVEAFCRLFHVAQAIQQYIRNNPKADAPCVKLLIVGAVDVEEGARNVVESVCQVDVVVDIDALHGSYDEFCREAVRMAMRAFDLFGQKFGWQKPDVAEFVAALATADPLCHARVDHLTKADRHGNRLEVWLDVTERETKIAGVVTRFDGSTECHVLARCDGVGYIDDMFPARSTIGDGRRFQLRDKHRNVISEVCVNASDVE